MAAVTAEQFTLFEIPAEEPKRVRTKWEQLQEMSAEAEQHGGFVPPFIAAVLLDVSRQRVNAMMETGILKRYEYFGNPFVTVNDIAAYMNGDRRGVKGRPPKTFKESLERVQRLRKEKC